ncbi:tRNA modification GTPase [Entomoplasma freundtii]|uniref:tRNA modification GTPase MnmE n=1 Tax=Entomoplasma freundtii TaxID=74700 RepID=A0A2K8NR83_9MOLU|nr:tRNA uridine-5-carboxymethylaminomethyl(34) synthesis GTPase MnmE [Entomoplasma freundtii]ATZ16046.1 tRNA modification GTPase TrmE [Entomoplasma freundtii]TDY58085.1 tRNA modification GTPase [Entomoplasma freundtii]
MQSTIQDTILAPATKITTQAIALLRISGDDAFKIINQVVKKRVPKEQGVFYRGLYDGDLLVDDVVITTFVHPNSFTGENVVEIACHGGVLNTERILQLILKTGARLALPGEFSQRAYLNGKITLVQAEGINDLIHAPSDLALKIGVTNMHGHHQKSLITLRTSLLDLISKIQVALDYPEYEDVEGVDAKSLEENLNVLVQEVKKLLDRSQRANKAISGVTTIIAGAPNVGKSSLLNALINEEKAIVTSIPGTTRDLVEGVINLPQGTLKLVDTAGIRETSNDLEKMGITKTINELKKAELILFVTTPNQIDQFTNPEWTKLFGNKHVLFIVNQIDRLSKKEQAKLKDKYPEAIFISALNDDLQPLLEALNSVFRTADLDSTEHLILTSAHQVALLKQILDKLKTAKKNLANLYPIDLINVDLYEAWDLLKHLLGETQDEAIIDNIFRKYCLGK